MSTHDRITEAFRAHEDLLPDTHEVLKNSADLARAYRRRTRTAQAVGGAVLGVGLVAAAVNVPSLFHHPQDSVATFGAGPSAAPTFSSEQALNEYFLKGYDYQNAVQLSALWHLADTTQVKTDAGMKLLNGETLPVTPGGTPSTPEDADTSRAVTAFFAKGYDYDDAARLAQLWHTATVWDSKVKAGHKVENGEELPVPAHALSTRIGFEVELLAPRGRSRRALADDLAARAGGEVVAVWHQDSEPSLVPGMGHFFHLSQGFEVRRGDGSPLCRLVDDITIVDDLDASAHPDGSWHRVLTDDRRILQLLAEHCDPAGDLATSLDAVGKLWGTEPTQHGPAVRLDDRTAATVALATLQGGERERPCEVVTPPIAHDHEAALEELLGPARELGFTVPVEAAVHLHLDGTPFRSADRLAHVIRLFGHRRDELRDLLGTNPRCRRLAPLPEELVAVADGTPTYDELRAASGRLTKFFDVNLTQLLRDDPVRDTLEIRILPGAITGQEIVARAALLEPLLLPA